MYRRQGSGILIRPAHRAHPRSMRPGTPPRQRCAGLGRDPWSTRKPPRCRGGRGRGWTGSLHRARPGPQVHDAIVVVGYLPRAAISLVSCSPGCPRRSSIRLRRLAGMESRAHLTKRSQARPGKQKSWRRPIFPKGCPLSIFGAGELNFRVRDGNGCGLSASVTRIPAREDVIGRSHRCDPRRTSIQPRSRRDAMIPDLTAAADGSAAEEGQALDH